MDTEQKKQQFGPSALRLNPKQLVARPPARCLFIPLRVAECWLSVWISYITGGVVPLKCSQLVKTLCQKFLQMFLF